MICACLYAYHAQPYCKVYFDYARSGGKTFPGPIPIPELPVIDWTKYSITEESVQCRLSGQRVANSSGSGGGRGQRAARLSGSGGGVCRLGDSDGTSGQLLVRGRVYNESKPQVTRLVPG
jgi:hypothetical protein